MLFRSVPTSTPTSMPSMMPTAVPTSVPSSVPTAVPTSTPTSMPSMMPTTFRPTLKKAPSSIAPYSKKPQKEEEGEGEGEGENMKYPTSVPTTRRPNMAPSVSSVAPYSKKPQKEEEEEGENMKYRTKGRPNIELHIPCSPCLFFLLHEARCKKFFTHMYGILTHFGQYAHMQVSSFMLIGSGSTAGKDGNLRLRKFTVLI